MVYNRLSNFITNNAKDVDLIVNFLVVAIPVILVNMQDFINPLASSVLIVILGIANIYSSANRRNKSDNNAEDNVLDEGA